MVLLPPALPVRARPWCRGSPENAGIAALGETRVPHTRLDLWWFLAVRGQNPWKCLNYQGNSGLGDILLIPSNSPAAEGRMCLRQPRPDHSGHFPASKGDKFTRISPFFLSSRLGGIHPETLCSAGIALSAPLSLLSISLSVSPPRPGSSALAIPIGTGPGVPGGADQGDVLPLGLWQLPSVLAHLCVWTLPKVPDFRGWIWCLLA